MKPQNYNIKSINKSLLEVRNLKVYFPIKKGVFSKIMGYVKAVDGVSFTANLGKTLGLVGESGCGKTTTGKTILNLIPKHDGKIIFDNIDLGELSRLQMRHFRREMQIIFQDPYGSLNPRMTIENIIGEALEIHHLTKNKVEKREKIASLLNEVGLSDEYMGRYPHEFSGGQRQRIGIARALAVNPKLIICDEPVSALDVSIQAQIVNLLQDIQEKFNFTYIFIAHDLSVVKHIAHRVAVMYLGWIVEFAHKDLLYRSPKHPYTQALLASVPIPDPTVKRKRIILSGSVPSPKNPPEGCRFHPRCPKAMGICKTEAPESQILDDGRIIRCHLY